MRILGVGLKTFLVLAILMIVVFNRTPAKQLTGPAT